MFDIPLPLANVLYGVANVALILGAILAVIGTVGTIWMGSIRELHAERRMAGNEERTAVAERKTEELRHSNTQLQIELEKERAERLRIEGKLKPRNISAEQRAQMVQTLSQSGPHKVEIWSDIDSESVALADQMKGVFEAAGWTVTGWGQAMGGSAMGIFVITNPEWKSSPNTQRALNGIVSAFMGANLLEEPVVDEHAPQALDTIKIRVGAKVT